MSDQEIPSVLSKGAKDGSVPKELRGALSQKKRSMTPAQRKISVQKVIRDRTASRRYGS